MDKMKKRGNPNWTNPEKMAVPRAGPTCFEGVAESLGLAAQDFEGSIPLKDWVRKNKDQKYVPPDLLKAWGFSVT